MSDAPRIPVTERVALDRSGNPLQAARPPTPATVAVPLTDLLDRPHGARDRQLNFGQPVIAINEDDGWFFVQAVADRYRGWVAPGALSFYHPAATHRVAVPGTHVYSHPDIKRGEDMALSIGALLAVEATEGPFARLATGGWVPTVHISAGPAGDPVAVAETLLGTPYLWGGNSRWGIDCSGLVQAALSACGIACPGDSGPQWREVGVEVPLADLQRGDLLFWRGHVAMAVDRDLLIHANGATMAVSHEGTEAALVRIEASGEGAFLGVKRP